MASLHHGGDDGQVLGCQCFAFGECPDAVADLQADIPQACDEALELACSRLVRHAINQNQNIDIRLWEELSAPVAANRNERRLLGLIQGLGPKQR